MSGFTYKGIHCSQFGVDYIPDAAAKWWDDPDFDHYTKNVSWKNGGYWYGTNVKIREIKLSCYFEEISMATREKIRRWFGRGTRGKLVFDDRPFVYYIVRPKSVVSGKIYNDNNDTFSGTFSVTFIATEPFGYLMRKSNTGTENDNAEDYCGIIETSLMPSAPSASGNNFDVYNPGTEQCGLTINIAGNAPKPIRFVNERNATVCEINSLPSSGTVLSVNGETGAIEIYAAAAPAIRDNGCAYHNYGIVRLEPDVLYRDASYTAVVNGTAYTLTLTGAFVEESMVGGLIRFNNPSTKTGRILSVNVAENKVTCSVSGSGTFQTTGTCSISSLNHIVIKEKNSQGNWVTPSSLSLSSISIDYSPRLL